MREVRRDTAESVRTPWWLWVVAAVLVALVTAAEDLDSGAQGYAGLALGVLCVAWAVAGRRSPRVAAVSGTLHRSALPAYSWLPLLLMGVGLGVLELLAGPPVHRWLTGSGMPAWVREHPHTTAAVPFAALCAALALLTSAVVRRMARRAADR
ncbi:hypothetical protein [Streptomyces sp. NPDC050560]|uniref:hypothetical protein n=1 Tax=Streptomyces sp. NPDC050560 TaxID=3365630 RepID=UPI0037B0810D